MHDTLNSPPKVGHVSASEDLQVQDIYRALAKHDEQTLERLAELAKDAEQYGEILSQYVGVHQYEITLPYRPHQTLEVNAALWMLPIVVAPNCRPPNSNNLRLGRLVSKYFGDRHASCSLSLLVSIAAVNCLKPLQVFTLLKLLSGDPSTNMSSQPRPNLAAADVVPGVPTLQFMIGCVQSADARPTFPRQIDFSLTDQIVKGLWVESPDSLMSAQEDIRVGFPAPIAQAITQGILLWLDEIEKVWAIQSWTLDPMGCDAFVLLLYVTPRQPGESKVISHVLQHWQLGAEGLKKLKQRCGGWALGLFANQVHMM